MTKHVHQHGRRFSRDELLVKATGRTMDPAPYIAHLTSKYSEIYGV
jgi:carboxypeptidase Taq